MYRGYGNRLSKYYEYRDNYNGYTEQSLKSGLPWNVVSICDAIAEKKLEEDFQ